MGTYGGDTTLPKRFGPFVLEKRLAVGGSAEVFLARPSKGIQPAPRLVIKRLVRAEREAGDYELLSREADLHTAVKHPNVVRVYGAGMIDEEPYLAMEYVEGVDTFRLLRSAQSESTPLPTDLVVHLARKVAEALGAVHTATDDQNQPLLIVHGDVSPSNVYLSTAGDVKLGDFGIARVTRKTTDESTAEGIRGKWGYVAPEVLDGVAVDHAADQFSLAAMLGEMLLGRRVFPGDGEIAVLLSIREADIEPLRSAADRLPQGLFPVLEKALDRDAARRHASCGELAQALQRFESIAEEQLRGSLAELVKRAADPSRLANRIEGRVRDSVQRMRAVKGPAGGPVSAPPISGASHVRRANGEKMHNVPFAKLVELIATGELEGHDEVAVMGDEYRPIDDIDELARHLLPSTTTKTGQLFDAGVPDFVSPLDSTPMLEVLSRMRNRRETGALFVERESNEKKLRKELYVKTGRLMHVASSDREELLGEYLVKRKMITRLQLESALEAMGGYGGRLGDTLVGLKILESMQLFRAIRDQGRDRVGALCAWKTGRVSFYRSTAPGPVQFPLDLDVASAMMSGAILATDRRPESLLPNASTRVGPGPRFDSTREKEERGTAPGSLQGVPSIVGERPTLGEAAQRLQQRDEPNRRTISPREAWAALAVAKHLGWIGFTT